ncbi:MAG TPA: hypothetical protein VFE62_19780 [Gemmataceae bacterium]|nr:hypothetical protein [Pirellulales bacterium]HZZ80753.1 hypothetical protein [Gemmataceae bacterium]
MSIRRSRLSAGMLAVAALLLLSDPSYAIYDGLGPSKDDWGIKYDVDLSPADEGKLTVEFKVADEGRLKPFYSATVVAFSKQADNQGRRSYDVKAPISFQTTADGKLAGQVQIPEGLADRAMIRILTLTVDGKKRSHAAYYDIPLKKYVTKDPATASSSAAPSAPKATKR